MSTIPKKLTAEFARGLSDEANIKRTVRLESRANEIIAELEPVICKRATDGFHDVIHTFHNNTSCEVLDVAIKVLKDTGFGATRDGKNVLVCWSDCNHK